MTYEQGHLVKEMLVVSNAMIGMDAKTGSTERGFWLGDCKAVLENIATVCEAYLKGELRSDELRSKIKGELEYAPAGEEWYEIPCDEEFAVSMINAAIGAIRKGLDALSGGEK